MFNIPKINNRLIPVNEKLMRENPPTPHNYDYYDEKSPMDGISPVKQ